MRSRWAPASLPPIITAGCSQASARSRQLSGSSSVGRHSTVRRSSARQMSTRQKKSRWPRSLAMSPTRRPLRPSLADEKVSPMR